MIFAAICKIPQQKPIIHAVSFKINVFYFSFSTQEDFLAPYYSSLLAKKNTSKNCL